MQVSIKSQTCISSCVGNKVETFNDGRQGSHLKYQSKKVCKAFIKDLGRLETSTGPLEIHQRSYVVIKSKIRVFLIRSLVIKTIRQDTLRKGK